MSAVISRAMGAPFILLGNLGSPSGSMSATTFAIDAAFVNATSGKAFGMPFTAPVGQTSGTLAVYAFLTAKTGSPTDVRAAIFAGPTGAMDPQRPDTGAAIATSAAVDVSSQSANTWTTFSITGLTLTVGVSYWLVIYNNTGTPASNFPTFLVRGFGTVINRAVGYTTTNGFTTDPSSNFNDAPIVLAFNDGSLFGNPYVRSIAHAFDSHDRGNRYTFSAPTQVIGVYAPTFVGVSNMTSIAIYQGATLIVSAATDLNNTTNTGIFIFATPFTFQPGVAYDVVGKFSGNTSTGTSFDANATPPTDVTNCMPSGLQYVDGTTPGSYTATNAFCNMLLLLNDVLGGGGGSFISRQAVNRAGMY